MARRRKQPKYLIGDVVYYATTEMMHNEEPAVRLQVLQSDYSLKYNCHVYRAMPIPEKRLSWEEVQEAAKQGATLTVFTVGDGTGKHSTEYREWELHTQYDMEDKYREVRWELRKQKRMEVERTRAVQSGGLAYAMYRYSAKRRKRVQ